MGLFQNHISRGWSREDFIKPPCARSLFNDLYDAAWEEVPWKTKRKDKSKNEKAWLREEKKTEQNPKTGKPKIVTYYIYQDVIPKAAFLDCLQMPEPWIKLWRNAIWSTLTRESHCLGLHTTNGQRGRQ